MTVEFTMTKNKEHHLRHPNILFIVRQCLTYKLIADNEKDNNEIIWEEDWGGGYPIDEETYENFKGKQEDKTEQKQAQNDIDSIVANALVEVIVENCLGE